MVVIMKRFKTKYPGVFFRKAQRVGGPGKEKVFYIVFKRDGKYYEEKVGRQYVDDMTAAKASRIRAERIENKRPSRKEIREKQKAKKWTINALWDEYMATHPENKSLAIEARKFNRNLRGTMGRKEPSELIPLEVDRIRLKLQREGKHTTAARVLELLRRTINFGINRNLVPPLAFKIEIPRLHLKALDEDKDQQCANLMRLALFTGMRRGELLKLEWDDIDTDRGFIKIRDPKGGPDQTIPLNTASGDVFNAIPKDVNSPYVFPGRKKSEHLKDMRKSIARIKANAGLPDGFRPLHGLRHVYASMLASSGKVDMYTLQKLLTHKSPIMTQRYAHLRDEALKRASELAGNIVTQASKQNSDKKIVNLEDRKN
jgi:integrase